MPEMLFLSEYTGSQRTAWVCKIHDQGLYAVIGYENNNEVYRETMATEQLAEDCAEDWIQLHTL